MAERDRSRSTGPALEKFPKAQRFTLGDRIQNSALEVLARLIEATYSRLSVSNQ